MRTLLQRVVVIIVSTILLSAAGGVAGYLLGHAFALSQAEARLDHYADRILLEAVTSTGESHAILTTMNTSPYEFCSDEELEYFRQLIFQSQNLKAAGRMLNGTIQCTTTSGRSEIEESQNTPTIVRQDGTRIYKNLPVFRVDNQNVISVQLGDSFIVHNPYNLAALDAPPMHFSETSSDAPKQLLGDMSQLQQNLLMRQGKVQANNTLYATRCSTDGATCITGYISLPDALAMSPNHTTLLLLLGAFAGGSMGLCFPLLYSRNKSMEHQLLRALRSDALSVAYQPIVDLSTGYIVEAEALVRWTDEYKNSVSPDIFVRIAEDRGFVGQITKLVLRHVLRDFGATMRARSTFRVNVNIAASDLADNEFLPMVERALAGAEVAPLNLGIEITEGYTASQQVARDAILRLRRKGHYVAIDDFGTGYSSLAYLHDLSVDAIKIDKAFTKAIGTDAVTVSILPQILIMAKTLKLRVVVEGIETAAQADYFAASNQRIHGQGWLFGHPVPARQFLQMLDEQESGIGKQQEEDIPVAVATF